MTDLTPDALAKLHDTLGGITVPDIMHGDNLAITLCTAYDNPDQDTDDETGWTPDAITGQEAVLAAIRAHYDPAVSRVIELERENAAKDALINEISDPEFLFGAMDNVADMDTTLTDFAEAASRAIRALLDKGAEG